ncbi:hypothetical protein SteCoe_16616 [Stentor coeruleus]|uniref:Uncharacterized protein n=1 Tax=Stentor coeruleus TaxID=5963 RepID=A0A1R2C123_9CILI|nr:hypothetical protein SteCoe_16616 [Stentor coeruleus]
MLSAGFKFICCSTEDDADNPKITWHENLLSMENLQVRQQEINNQVTLTFVAFNNDFTAEGTGLFHRKNKSQDSYSRYSPIFHKKTSLVSSLYSLSKATNTNIAETIED